MVKMSQNFKFISVVDTKLLTIANVRFYHFQTFIRVLRRVRNFVVISGWNKGITASDCTLDGIKSIFVLIVHEY